MPENGHGLHYRFGFRVNLILFEPHETDVPLPRSDRRARHLIEVLRRRPGDSFDAGLVNGPLGKGRLTAVDAMELHLAFVWEAPLPVSVPLILVLGLTRPQTARDILRDATTLGATELHFVAAERSDPNYAQSTLWTSGEAHRHLVAGAEQAFDPRLPSLTSNRTLADCLATLPNFPRRLALDNYEASGPLLGWPTAPCPPTVVAIGPERGWGASDRAILRTAGFSFAHLGARVLRTETAVVAALAILNQRTV